MMRQQLCRAILYCSRVLHVDGLIPDKLYLKLLYRRVFNRRLNLENPKTYNEKLFWMKLYNRRPEYSMMVDKYAVKDYVARIIGPEYIIPTIGVWEKPEDIDWESLPNQFVLKCTHDSGGLVICKDKSKLDIRSAERILKDSFQTDYYKAGREWPYKNVPKRILAEKYLEDGDTGDLPDYKFFCFDGVVKALFIATERSSGDVKFDYYDADFNHLDLVQLHPMSGKQQEKPKCFEQMKQLASLLSQGIPHVRVDFYCVNDAVYFGEMTFFHHGGVIPFHPADWDYTFGSWIKLPPKRL